MPMRTMLFTITTKVACRITTPARVAKPMPKAAADCSACPRFHTILA